MDFQLTEEHLSLQQRCRQLAEDFATRAALHDREATDPIENYALLRQAGLYALNVPTDLGGWGMGLLVMPSPRRSWRKAAQPPPWPLICTCVWSGRSWRARWSPRT